jgi:Fic family protein
MLLCLYVNENILKVLRSKLLSKTSLENLPETVWMKVGAVNTWGTNALEGNTLTLSEVEDVLFNNRSPKNRPVTDVTETIQHYAAFKNLMKHTAVPITLETVLELHETVFRGVYEHAGRWRWWNVAIRGSKHTPPRYGKIVPMMEDWLGEYTRRIAQGEGVFPLGAWMHHRFETIHPFGDGNGRVGRLLLNLHFLKHSWPPVHILEPEKSTYKLMLEEGTDKGGDVRRLTDFLEIQMAKSLLDILDQVGTSEDELKPLKSIAEDAPYSANYLTLRAGQGELPALKVKHRLLTSRRAVGLYREFVGRQ